MKNKIILLVSSVALLASGLAACGGKSNGDEDPTKANITVATLDKGIGTAWLTNAAKEFEELYKDSTEFQDGRVGVKVNISGSTQYDGEYVKNSVLNKDIYFTEGINYRELVNDGKFLDITDVLTEELTGYGENKTILSKIDASMANYLNVKDKYYGIPFYDSFYGLVYDVSLWKEKGLYLSKDGKFVRQNGDLSLGTDNVAGTLDDGLPATYEEFAKLIKYLSDLNITPYVNSLNGIEYSANYLYNVLADYEGADNLMLNHTLDGVATDLVDSLEVNDDGSIKNVTYKSSTTITNDNGYELTRQVGRYQALHFMNDILLSSKNNYKTENTHTTAQQTFVYGKQNQKPIAMIMEGSWWENEASNTLKNYEKTYGERSDYAIMPIPFASAEKAAESGYKHTALSLSQSFGIVSATTRNAKLAKEFMRFLHSDKMMSKFTRDTSITRPLNYEITPDDQEHLSTYAKSLIDLKKNAEIVYPYSTNQFEIDNSYYFNAFNFIWNSEIDGSLYRHPWLYFVGGGSNPSALKYFDGQYKHFQVVWQSLVK